MKTIKNKLILGLSTGALILIGLFFSPYKFNFINQNKPSDFDFRANSNTTKQHNFTVQQAQQELPFDQQKLSLMIDHLPEADQLKWQTFESIIIAKNDNDPRIDLELKKLSPQLHQALYEKYNTLKREEHNSRGFIVFLIARNLQSKDDIEFLKKIYQEDPCLSLSDCHIALEDDPHHNSTNQMTLVYSQMSGLYSIEKQLIENPNRLNNSTFRDEILQILIQAENFPVISVQNKAHQLRSRFKL